MIKEDKSVSLRFLYEFFDGNQPRLKESLVLTFVRGSFLYPPTKKYGVSQKAGKRKGRQTKKLHVVNSAKKQEFLTLSLSRGFA